MTIREKGYYRWEGQLKTAGIRWLPIFFNGIRMVFKKRFSKFLFGLTISPFWIFLIGVWVSQRPELKMFRGMVKLLQNEAVYFKEFYTNGFSIFMLMLLGIFFGAEMITGDIKYKSFPLYFSRPLDRKDYISGKLSIIMFYYLLFTLAPGILLYIFKVIFTGKMDSSVITLLAIIITPVIIAFYMASITLLVSSFSGNPMYVRIMLIVIFFVTEPIAQLLKEIFGGHYFLMIAFTENLRQMGAFLFQTGPIYSYPGWMSLAFVLIISLGAILILYIRIGKLEAQIESGN